MRKYWIMLLVALAVGISSLALAASDPFEDYLPIQPGMKLNLIDNVEHMDQKDQTWRITVNKNSFPDSITYTWVRPQKEGPEWTGTRILTDLNLSRNFNPWFRKDESKATSDTAPWLSLQVMKELRETGKATNYREGGTGAINWAAATLSVKEKIIYPMTINGKAEALHAFRLNKNMVVWNNLKNPLILEYMPYGVPLFVSITGWKVTEINY